MTDFKSVPLRDKFTSTLLSEIDSVTLSANLADAPGFTVPVGQTCYMGIDYDIADKYELVVITSVSGSTVTFSSRGAATIDGVAGVAQSHGSGAKVVISANYKTFQDIATAINSKLDKSGGTLTGPVTAPVYADAAARDVAIPTPANGMSVYLTAEAKFTDYVSGSWVDRGISTPTPNASLTVAGKVELATDVELAVGTPTGASGAPLVMTPENIVQTSLNSPLQGKPVGLNSLGLIDSSLLPQFLQFGGSGGDGDLTVNSGTTTLNLDQLYEFNNVTINSPGILAFTGTNGTAYLKIKGDFAGDGTIELRNSCTSTPKNAITNFGEIASSNAAAVSITTETGGTGGRNGYSGTNKGGDGGTSTAAGTGAGGAGGTSGTPGGTGTAGSGGATAGVGGGGGGGGGGSGGVGTAGTTSVDNNGGVGGAGASLTSSSAGNWTEVGGGGGGGGGLATGNGGAGGAAGTFTFNGALNSNWSNAYQLADGGAGGNSGATGGTGGNGGNAQVVTASPGSSIGPNTDALTRGFGGDGGDGYSQGGVGGTAASGTERIYWTSAANLRMWSLANRPKGGDGGNSSHGTGGQGGSGGTFKFTSVNSTGSFPVDKYLPNGGDGGDGRVGGAGGKGGSIETDGTGSSDPGDELVLGDGGNGGNAQSGCAGLLALVDGAVTFIGTINAQGGNGGAGGQGGTVSGSGSYLDSQTPGNGGDGGDASDGADVVILAVGAVSSPTINTAGGIGGAAGAAGTNSQNSSLNGVAGTAGANGRTGKAICQTLLI